METGDSFRTKQKNKPSAINQKVLGGIGLNSNTTSDLYTEYTFYVYILSFLLHTRNLFSLSVIATILFGIYAHFSFMLNNTSVRGNIKERITDYIVITFSSTNFLICSSMLSTAFS